MGKADSSVSKPALLSAQFKRKFDVTSLGAKTGPAGRIVYKAYWILLTSRETDSQITFKDFEKFYGWVPAVLPGDCGEPALKMSRVHVKWVLTPNPGNFLPSTITRTIAKQKQKRGMQLHYSNSRFFHNQAGSQDIFPSENVNLRYLKGFADVCMQTPEKLSLGKTTDIQIESHPFFILPVKTS